jgi:hypothetical protein
MQCTLQGENTASVGRSKMQSQWWLKQDTCMITVCDCKRAVNMTLHPQPTHHHILPSSRSSHMPYTTVPSSPPSPRTRKSHVVPLATHPHRVEHGLVDIRHRAVPGCDPLRKRVVVRVARVNVTASVLDGQARRFPCRLGEMVRVERVAYSIAV